jgi:hypothetical protein
LCIAANSTSIARSGSQAPGQFEDDHVRSTTDRASFGASRESALWATFRPHRATLARVELQLIIRECLPSPAQNFQAWRPCDKQISATTSRHS